MTQTTKTKTKSIDRPTAQLIAREAEKALRELAERYGLTVRARGGTFTDSNLIQKFEFAVMGNGGVPMGKDAQAYRRHFENRGGFHPLGAEVDHSRLGKVTIVGARPRSRNPILVKTESGVTYKVGEHAAKTPAK